MFSSPVVMTQKFKMILIHLIFLVCVAVVVAATSMHANAFSSPDSRIVNGVSASRGQFPHQVSLRLSKNKRHFCGGSILTQRWILTSYWCSSGNGVADLIAVIGSTDLQRGGTVYQIDIIRNHPQEDIYKNQNDIALLKTTKNIVFDKLAQPIRLPTKDTPGNLAVVVSGWGALRVKTSEKHISLPQE